MHKSSRRKVPNDVVYETAQRSSSDLHLRKTRLGSCPRMLKSAPAILKALLQETEDVDYAYVALIKLDIVLMRPFIQELQTSPLPHNVFAWWQGHAQQLEVDGAKLRQTCRR